jgi:glycosyltransferase involved in cell wall biosynthesis
MNGKNDKGTPKETKNSVSIIVPCYNEENAVRETAEELVRTMTESGWDFEILMINDGSSDKTGEILDALEPQIRVLHNDPNLGYGGTLKRGFRDASHEIILITDADGTYPNKDIPSLLEHIHQYDMVVGARTGANVKIPLVRRPAKWFITKLASYLAEYPIPDLNSGLRIMKKPILERFGGILPEGFSLTTTITLAMLTTGYLVKFVPINYFHRVGQSSIRPVRDTLKFIQLIVRTVMYFRPLKVFAPASLAFLVAAIGILTYSLLFSDNVMDIAVMTMFICSVQSMGIGLLADLIDKRR